MSSIRSFIMKVLLYPVPIHHYIINPLIPIIALIAALIVPLGTFLEFEHALRRPAVVVHIDRYTREDIVTIETLSSQFQTSTTPGLYKKDQRVEVSNDDPVIVYAFQQTCKTWGYTFVVWLILVLWCIGMDNLHFHLRYKRKF